MKAADKVLIHSDKSGARWYAPVMPYTKRIWVGGKLVWERELHEGDCSLGYYEPSA